ncbi:hypothetical protein MAR_021148, partial [Mya arenaria]
VTQCPTDVTINATTSSSAIVEWINDPPPSNAALIGGLAGGISAVCVAFVSQIAEKNVNLNLFNHFTGYFGQSTKHKKGESCQALSKGQNSFFRKLRTLNAVEEDADAKYQGNKKQRIDAHDNAGLDIYENNQSSQHPVEIFLMFIKNVNHDGLVYTDIVFANPPKGQKHLVIHGIDDMTVYADVDLTKNSLKNKRTVQLR